MISGSSLIDNLVLAPMALAPAGLPDDRAGINTGVSLRTPGGRKLPFAVPFFARGDMRTKSDSGWNVLCGILRKFGLPLYASVNDLEPVPATNVPARVAVRALGQPLSKNELNTADAFELATCDVNGQHWGWPYEIEGNRDLKSFVQVLREATGGEIPIGISLPLGATAADMRCSIESSVDFITLKYSQECLAVGAGQLSSFAAVCVLNARRQCTQLGRTDLPLLLDAPITEIEHIIKLLALGATAVNVGAMLVEALPTPAPLRVESKFADSLLGSMAMVPKSVNELPQVERCLSTLVVRLKSSLQYAGLVDVQHLDSNSLRSLCKNTAEYLGISLLGGR
jgi:hypothetical protein